MFPQLILKIKKFIQQLILWVYNESNHNYKKITTYFILQKLFQEKQQEVVSSGPINIGNDVWIGAGCKILSGVTIGNGAIIGANAIVTNDIPPYAIAAGNPARVIKFRFSNEIIQNLEKIKWWDWPIEKIKTHKWLFDKELTLEMLNQIT
jgi:virginiamycin A acetyltransferase